jgi:hypothetical protein
VKGFPSCHWTFFLSFQVTDVPSLAMPPFWTVGISAARFAHQVAVGIERREGLVEDREPSWILRAVGEVRVEEGGRLPPEHLDRAAAAPLGRAKAGFVCACATPAEASIWAARAPSGPFRPSCG